MNKVAIMRAVVDHFGTDELTLVDSTTVVLDTGEVHSVEDLGISTTIEEKQTELDAWEVRRERNTILAKSDSSVLPDKWSTMTQEQQTAWATYRQALRELPEQSGFPNNVTWPTQP